MKTSLATKPFALLLAALGGHAAVERDLVTSKILVIGNCAGLEIFFGVRNKVDACVAQVWQNKAGSYDMAILTAHNLDAFEGVKIVGKVEGVSLGSVKTTLFGMLGLDAE